MVQMMTINGNGLRKTYEREIQRLETEILALGDKVGRGLLASVEALRDRDRQRSVQIIVEDEVVNAKRFDLEANCLTLIATQQPAGRDLRTIAAILEIASELERIYDYAKGISKINLLLADEPLMKPLVDIPRMAQKAQGMLHRALLAFSRRDVVLAREIPREDDEVDALYNQVYRELFTYAIGEPATLNQFNYLLWTAHNLERAADRVTNICERVVFCVTGQFVELDLDKELVALLDSVDGGATSLGFLRNRG